MAPKRTFLIEGSFWISVSGTIPFIVPGKKTKENVRMVLTKGHPCTGRLVVDPEGDPGEHDNEDGGQVRLENKVTNVSL